MPPEHLRRLTGVAVLSISPLRKRVPVLPPKYLRRKGGERLVRGWKILSPELLQYRVSCLLARRKKRRTRWLISFITLERESEQGASFKRTIDVTPEVMGEVNQHSADKGSEEQALVVMDSPEMGFHGQPTVETAHLADLGEVPLTHEEAWRVFPQSRLLAGQPRLCRPGPGVVGRCFLIGYYYILIFLRRAKLPLWRKYQLLGPKEPRKLSSVGSHSIEANPRPPVWSNYTQQCFGC